MASESAAMTILVDGEWNRFCANCGMVMGIDRKSLIKHCNMKHGTRYMGFLDHGNQPHKCMYKNFEEWLMDDSLELEEKEDYVF